MSIQIIHGNNGNPAGVCIPINDWNAIKSTYPDIENLENNIPDWQIQLLDARLNEIEQNPDSIKPIQQLFDNIKVKSI